MSQVRDLPKRLASCCQPECAACHFGKATKVPWRMKGQSNHGKIKPVTAPGQCVSVDQLKSTTPGLVTQLKGRATRNCCCCVTMFVDHHSGLSCIHLMKQLTSEETLRAKKAFKACSRSLGVQMLHCHANNGRFANNAFITSVTQSGQTISYCGVNAHFQNGRAEKCIQDPQDQA